MRLLLLMMLFCSSNILLAQPASGDSSAIVQIPDQMARFPGCEALEGGKAEKQECANKNMLSFVYSNIRYPQAAVDSGIAGQVVLRFVVEKNGRISDVEVLKDIGGGCGEEARRVLELMNQLQQSWTPAVHNGTPVRSYFTLPVKFKLEEYTPPEFSLIGRDTIWLKMDKTAEFKGGAEALSAYIEKELDYPQGLDSCIIGELEIQAVITADGRAVILDLLDYDRLNIDFLYEAVDLVHSTNGSWTPAEYKGRPVNTTYTFRLSFLPKSAACEQRVADYEQAKNWSEAAVQLFDDGKQEEAIANWDKAIELFPRHAEFLAYRGQALLDQNRLEEACADLQMARSIMLVAWYNDILQLICK